MAPGGHLLRPSAGSLVGPFEIENTKWELYFEPPYGGPPWSSYEMAPRGHLLTPPWNTKGSYEMFFRVVCPTVNHH